MKCFQMGIVFLVFIFHLDQFVNADVSTSEDSVVIPGDVMIIALFSVHRKGPQNSGCGEIQQKAGLQRVEVALQQIEQFNRNKGDKICSLGIFIKDTCEHGPSTQDLKYKIEPGKFVLGIIGPATSEETKEYNSYYSQCPFVQVGYGATSSKLIQEVSSYPSREYPFDIHHPSRMVQSDYIRVVPSDKDQVQVIMSIVKKFPNCSAINIIGSPDGYGRDGVDEFSKQASNQGVCIHRKLILASKNQDFFDILDNTVRDIQILVCFCDGDTVRDILLSVKEMNMTRKFVFIATDRWAERDGVLKDLDTVVEEHFFINIKSTSKFDVEITDYPTLKKRTENSVNHWLNDSLINNGDGNFQDKKLPFVKESIKLFTDMIERHAIKFQNGSCSLANKEGRDRLCPDRKHWGPPLPYWNSLYESSTTRFDSSGNPDRRDYEISTYRKEDGVFKWVSVGTWSNGKPTWEGDFRPPVIEKLNSHCRMNCTPGEYIDDVPCCWKCEPCRDNTFTVSGYEFKCKNCSERQMSNDYHTGCIPKNEERIYWNEPDALICIIISVLGILTTLLSAYVFYTHLEAPIVKYATPDLSFIIFCGMILAYGYTFLLVIKPTPVICTIIRFWTSISLTMMYGPLLVKINRTSRAFTVTKLREPYLNREYFSTEFLMKLFSFFFAAELIMIGVVDYLVFYYVEPWKEDYSFPRKITFFCTKDEANQLISRQLVNILLLAYCCVYAFKTIKLPDNFYESKFILSSCGTTFLLWIFYILMFTTQSKPRGVQIALSLVLSMSAFICLAGLILPKLYIILRRPRNYKAYFSVENKLQQNLSNTDSMVMDISLWEYLGVASRISPDVVDESELKSTEGAPTE